MRTQDIDRIYKEIIVEHYKEIEEATGKVAISALLWKTDLSKRLIKKLEDNLTQYFDDIFREAVVRSNIIVKDEVARLANNIDLPVKYNKDLLETFNTDKSIYSGFYDKPYQKEFTKREIYRLKSGILKGKYNKLTEKQMVYEIRKIVKVSQNRALVIARQETARLDSAAKSIYYNNTKVKNRYNKVWHSHHDEVTRTNHERMDGKIADTNGWFTTPEGDKTQGSPYPGSFGCRCWITLEPVGK